MSKERDEFLMREAVRDVMRPDRCNGDPHLFIQPVMDWIRKEADRKFPDATTQGES